MSQFWPLCHCKCNIITRLFHVSQRKVLFFLLTFTQEIQKPRICVWQNVWLWQLLPTALHRFSLPGGSHEYVASSPLVLFCWHISWVSSPPASTHRETCTHTESPLLCISTYVQACMNTHTEARTYISFLPWVAPSHAHPCFERKINLV